MECSQLGSRGHRPKRLFDSNDPERSMPATSSVASTRTTSRRRATSLWTGAGEMQSERPASSAATFRSQFANYASTRDITSPDGPFGELSLMLQVHEDAIAVQCGTADETTEDDIDVHIRAKFADLLHWLHGDDLLGHLLYRGCAVRGDLLALSALDGVVSATSADEPPRHAIALIAAYARGRNHPETLSLLDLIEAHTLPPIT